MIRFAALLVQTPPTRSIPPVSVRSLELLGWAFVGYCPRQEGERFNDEIVVVKLGASKAVRRYAQQHSDFDLGGYLAETHAIPSPDGSRVMFASN